MSASKSFHLTAKERHWCLDPTKVGWTHVPSPAVLWRLIPRSFLQALLGGLTGLDPAQLMADARAAATYCITKQHALWDTPPAEAGISCEGRLVLMDCFMGPSLSGNLAALPAALRPGQCRLQQLTHLGFESQAPCSPFCRRPRPEGGASLRPCKHCSGRCHPKASCVRSK
eukprot:s2636_g2.t1